MVKNLLLPLNQWNFGGSGIVILNIILVILYSISEIITINREQLGEPPGTEMIITILSSLKKISNIFADPAFFKFISGIAFNLSELTIFLIT